MDKEIVLQMKGITKEFPGVKALDNVDFTLRAGEVHGLMGENGAGKSTLMKILQGIYACDQGTIELKGKKVQFKNPGEAIASGISMIHQELNLIPEMTVAENIFLGREAGKYCFIDFKQMNRACDRLMQTLDLNIAPTLKVSQLTVAGQQMIEIAKTVSYDSRILIMDEPTSAISDNEVQRLFTIIRSLTAKGVAVVYISHRMDEIFSICDRITVLRDGQHVLTETAQTLTRNELIRAMVGRTLEDYYPKEFYMPGDVLLRVEGLSSAPKFSDVSFEVRAGEVVGFAGMMGAGRTEICETIFGMRKKTDGHIYIDGQEVDIRSPADAVKNGIALVSEDRKQYGLNLLGSVRDNIVLSALSRINRNIFINEKRLNAIADERIRIHDVKTPGRDTLVESLSGGNQQKVVLAKWMLTKSRILILDEPTRGIDVGAKTEIYRLINDLAKQGIAIIMVSSEMPEVCGMSDRVIVFSEGSLRATFDRKDVTQEAIMQFASPNREVAQ
jgi:ABC-type sugar transport system ATPase subunit